MMLAVSIAVALVFASGTFLLLQRDLTRAVVGIVLASNSAVLFLIAAGLTRGEPPILPLPDGSGGSPGVADPLVQAMSLTALIIGFATAALILSMTYRLYTAHRTLDLEEIAEREIREAVELERSGEPPEKEEIPTEEMDSPDDGRTEAR